MSVGPVTLAVCAVCWLDIWAAVTRREGFGRRVPQEIILAKFHKNLSFFLLIFIGNYSYGLYKLNTSKYNFDTDLFIKIVSPNFSLKDYQTHTEEFQLKRLIKVSDPEYEKKTLFHMNMDSQLGKTELQFPIDIKKPEGVIGMEIIGFAVLFLGGSVWLLFARIKRSL